MAQAIFALKAGSRLQRLLPKWLDMRQILGMQALAPIKAGALARAHTREFLPGSIAELGLSPLVNHADQQRQGIKRCQHLRLLLRVWRRRTGGTQAQSRRGTFPQDAEVTHVAAGRKIHRTLLQTGKVLIHDHGATQ